MTRETIATELSDILEIPRLGRRGKSWKIVCAVIQAMTEGLLRDGYVRVEGFGVFRIRQRPAVRRGCYFFPYLGKGQHVEVNVIPAKRYVHFTPAPSIVRTLNDR